MVFAKYLDHAGVKSPNSTADLPECTDINDYFITMTFQIICRRSNIAYLQEKR